MTIELPVKIRVDGMPEANSSIKQFAQSWDLAKIAISGVAGAMGAMAIYNKVNTFVKDSVRLAKEAVEANTQLEAAYGKNTTGLIEYASALSSVTTFSRDNIISTESVIASIIKDEKHVKLLTKASLDFAAANKYRGITAESAAQLLIRAVEGEGQALGRYGIKIGEATTREGRFQEVLKAVTKTYGDRAEALAKTDLGKMEQAENKIKEIQEGIGKEILPMMARWYQGFYDLIKPASFVGGLIHQAGLAMRLMAGESKQALEAENKIWEAAQKGGKEGIATLQTYSNTIAVAAGEQNAIVVKWDEYNQKTYGYFDKSGQYHMATMKMNEKEQKQYDEAVRKKAELLDIQNKINSAIDAMTVKEEKSVDLTGKAGKQKAEKPIKIAEGDEPWYADPKNMEEMAKQAKEAADNLKELTDAGVDAAEEAGGDAFSRKQKQIQKQHDKEAADLKKFLQKKLITQKQYDEATAINERITDTSIKENKKEFHKEILSSTLGMLDQLTAGSKKSAGLHKTIAEGEALVSAGSAEMGVLENSGKFIKWMGPIAGPIVMGVEMALIAGLAAEQIATIASAKMAYGGVATGGISGSDSVPAMLMPGEIVYNPAHPNPALASMITNTENTANTHNYHISMPITVHGNPTNTTIAKIGEVTERALLSAMRRAQNSGKLSATGLVVRR